MASLNLGQDVANKQAAILISWPNLIPGWVVTVLLLTLTSLRSTYAHTTGKRTSQAYLYVPI